MSKKLKTILDAALALPERDRTLLAGRLFESLPPPPNFEQIDEAEFAQELDRRKKEMEDEIDPGIPWSQVKKMR